MAAEIAPIVHDLFILHLRSSLATQIVPIVTGPILSIDQSGLKSRFGLEANGGNPYAALEGQRNGVMAGELEKGRGAAA
jgi:hypothetical protein